MTCSAVDKVPCMARKKSVSETKSTITCGIDSEAHLFLNNTTAVWINYCSNNFKTTVLLELHADPHRFSETRVQAHPVCFSIIIDLVTSIVSIPQIIICRRHTQGRCLKGTGALDFTCRRYPRYECAGFEMVEQQQ